MHIDNFRRDVSCSVRSAQTRSVGHQRAMVWRAKIIATVRQHASDARFDGVRFERSSSTVSPICERNRFARASYSADVSAILELSQQRRDLRDTLGGREPARFESSETRDQGNCTGSDHKEGNDKKREVCNNPKASERQADRHEN